MKIKGYYEIPSNEGREGDLVCHGEQVGFTSTLLTEPWIAGSEGVVFRKIDPGQGFLDWSKYLSKRVLLKHPDKFSYTMDGLTWNPLTESMIGNDEILGIRFDVGNRFAVLVVPEDGKAHMLCDGGEWDNWDPMGKEFEVFYTTETANDAAQTFLKGHRAYRNAFVFSLLSMFQSEPSVTCTFQT